MDRKYFGETCFFLRIVDELHYPMSAKPVIKTCLLRFVATVGWITTDVCVCLNQTLVARKRNLTPCPRWYGSTVFTPVDFQFLFLPVTFFVCLLKTTI